MDNWLLYDPDLRRRSIAVVDDNRAGNSHSAEQVEIDCKTFVFHRQTSERSLPEDTSADTVDKHGRDTELDCHRLDNLASEDTVGLCSFAFASVSPVRFAVELV